MEINQYLLLMLTIYSLYRLSVNEIKWIYMCNDIFNYLPKQITNIDIYKLKAISLYNDQLNIYLNSYIYYSLIIFNYMLFSGFTIKHGLIIFLLINSVGMIYTYIIYMKEYFNSLDLDLDFKDYLSKHFLSQKIQDFEILNSNCKNIDSELNLIDANEYDKYVYLFNECFNEKYTPLTKDEFLNNLVFMKNRLFAKINNELFVGMSINNEFIVHSFNFEENSFSNFLKQIHDIDIKKYENYYIYTSLLLIITFFGGLK